MVHTVAFAWFARVWLWHLTPAARGLPGARGFGWFVRFLTFYSYTLQTATLGVATASDWSRLVRARALRRALQAHARERTMTVCAPRRRASPPFHSSNPALARARS